MNTSYHHSTSHFSSINHTLVSHTDQKNGEEKEINNLSEKVDALNLKLLSNTPVIYPPLYILVKHDGETVDLTSISIESNYSLLLSNQHKLLQITKIVVTAPPLLNATLQTIEDVVIQFHGQSCILVRYLKHKGEMI